jgi:hypothetical protein
LTLSLAEADDAAHKARPASPDLASREPMKAKFYEGELWKRELEAILMPMLEKYEVVVVDDSDNLIQW